MLAQFREVSNTRIFNTPDLFGIVFRVSRQCGLGFNAPVVDTVVGTRDGEMRVTAAIFDAAQQERGAVSQARRASVENTIDGIGPIAGAQDRIRLVAAKKFGMLIVHQTPVVAEANAV